LVFLLLRIPRQNRSCGCSDR